jgi:putative transposase
MEERLKFIQRVQAEEECMAELCREFGVSRKTGYKWLERYENGGVAALADQSRAPHHQANAISEERLQTVLQARAQHRRWGPEKLRSWLLRKHPEQPWPAASTIGEILKRAGLTVKAGKSLWVAPTPGQLQQAEQANHVWCADFKGYFHCQDGSRCDPLTLTDNYSRFLLRCQAVMGTDAKYARAFFEAAFREYGLPQIIRTDNGSPFASVALAGLSELSVWWIKLGIWLERIDPGKPQQNGRHERMHRTLKQETAQPPGKTLRRQQHAFDQFRQEYNYERPHEALGMKRPGDLYVPSCRRYPEVIRQPEYGADRIVRTVGSCGRIRWCGERVFITKVLGNDPIGLEGVDDGVWRLWFGAYPIGWLDERTMVATDLDRPPKKHTSETQSAVETVSCRDQSKNRPLALPGAVRSLPRESTPRKVKPLRAHQQDEALIPPAPPVVLT